MCNLSLDAIANPFFSRATVTSAQLIQERALPNSFSKRTEFMLIL
jgi:hypothetical protein